MMGDFIIGVCVLYEAGYSIDDIAERYRMPNDYIADTLKEAWPHWRESEMDRAL